MARISDHVLSRLPFPGTFLGVKDFVDMDGVLYTAIIWEFSDENDGTLRVAAFDLHTGKYLGEA